MYTAILWPQSIPTAKRTIRYALNSSSLKNRAYHPLSEQASRQHSWIGALTRTFSQKTNSIYLSRWRNASYTAEATNLLPREGGWHTLPTKVNFRRAADPLRRSDLWCGAPFAIRNKGAGFRLAASMQLDRDSAGNPLVASQRMGHTGDRLFVDPQFGCRAKCTKSRSAETLALYAPTRAASTGRPSRSATRELIPASSSSERLKPTTGTRRFAPEGATGHGGGSRCQRRCGMT